MKKNIHPTLYPAIFRDIGVGVDVYSTTTMKGSTQEKIGDVEYQVIPIEISAASHPFYTGKDRIIDAKGRVEKFRSRAQKAKNV